MAEPLLSNPDPDAPSLVGGEYGQQAFQSVEQPSGERTVENVPRATMVQPAPLPSDFGVFHDLVPNEPPAVGGIDFGTFSDLVPRRPPPPPSITPASDAVVAATEQLVLPSNYTPMGQMPASAYQPGQSPQEEIMRKIRGKAAAKAGFETVLSPTDEAVFQQWKSKYAPQDSGQDYDLRGAFKAGLTPDPQTGHWPDTFKKPNHPTFSDQSMYAQFAPEKAGHWEGDKYIPPDHIGGGPQVFTPQEEKAAVIGAPQWTAELAKPAVSAGKVLAAQVPTSPEQVQSMAPMLTGTGTTGLGGFVREAFKTGVSLAASMKAATQTKPFSQEWWDAVMPVAMAGLQEAGLAIHAIPGRVAKPPVQVERPPVQVEAPPVQAPVEPAEAMRPPPTQEAAPSEAVPPTPAETLVPQPEPPVVPESEVPSAPATQLAPEVPLPQAEPIPPAAAEQPPTVAEPAPPAAAEALPATPERLRVDELEREHYRISAEVERAEQQGTATEEMYARLNEAEKRAIAAEDAADKAEQAPPRAAEPPQGGAVEETKLPPVKPSDKVYDNLLGRGKAVGPNLYELTEKQVTPALRKKLDVRGRPEETDSFSLRPKADVTGNPYDRGWILKDKRPDFARRATQPRVAEPPQVGETKYMHPSERPEVPKITEVPPEHVPPEPESNDWTTATEPIEKQAGKLKLKADKEGGFVDLSGVADVGRRIYERGVDFARWSAEMIRHLGEKIKPHLQAVWDFVSGKHFLPGTAEAGGIGKTGRRKAAFGAKLLPGYSELDALTGKRSAKLQKSTADVERITKEFKKVAKTPRVENAMSAWAEAGGDLNELKRQQGLAKGKMVRQAVTDAQKLTPEQQALALKGRQTFDIMGKRVAHYGMLNNFRQNYVPHLFDVGMRLTGFGSAKLQSKFKFAKAAKYQTFFEADQAGLKPKTMEMGKLLGLYTEHANQLIADRQFVQGAQVARSEAGEPLAIPRGRAGPVQSDSGGQAVLVNPHSFKTATDLKGNPVDQLKYRVDPDQPALRKWLFSGKDTQGKPIFMEDDLAIHPELAKRLRAMTGRSRIRMAYDEPSAGGLSVIPKAILKNLDTAQAVMKREMFGLLAPFHQVQEGTHAVSHTVNPFFNIPKMHKLTPAMIDAAEHGLIMKSERGTTAAAMEGLGGKGQFAAQMARKFGGPAGRKVADVLDGYQDYLFEHYIPGLKFKTYEHMLPRNMKLYAKELKAGEVTEGDIKMLSAQQSNAAYGKLNFALLDRSPTLQHILQGVLIAPDFLEARGKFVSQAAKSFLGSKAGQEQLRAIAVMTMTQAGLAYVITKGIGGEWDPKKPFDVNNADGTRSYFLRSVPEDFARLVLQGTEKRREFISARINPLLNTVDQIVRSGRNYRGEKITTAESIWELVNNYVPIMARSIPGIRELTETSRNSPISPWERFAGSAGIKVSRTSPITKTYTMAHDWKEAQGLPKDTGTYPVSKYQQMRYALEDNNQEKAADEFQKLLDAAGGNRKKVLAGFHESLNHPFTESKAMDLKFRNSLDGPSRAIYDKALDRRHEIMRRFNAMKAFEVRAVSR